ncbi:nucleoside kinase [Lepagella muris]|jgi:uridine kinase|uniref:Nucleoside kinase n=1 Tax=Lepagella muris TaxID=3032870 RepID=A0AC61RDY2_9BACT|nr:nucleoside kinase [Lepagella muris]TGY76808.1 nucleoside kinase [Lepagella muris]THG47924.1 nucleoside kinase [Bacteroidales bacterium]TKC54569.1 nucleoside kinase [Bacteroidales bacterium]
MKIYCKNTDSYVNVLGGEKIIDMLPRLRRELAFEPICALVNNKTEDLCFPLFAPRQVEFVGKETPAGRRVYVRSLCMMLYKAVEEVMPGVTLRIEHSMSKGHYCRLLKDEAVVSVTQETVDVLLAHLRNLRDTNIPFRRKERMTKDAIEIFRKQRLTAKVTLLETLHELYTTYYRLGSLADSYYGPLAPSTGFIRDFDLRVYKDGFLLFAMSADKVDEVLKDNPPQEKMYKAFTDQLMFNKVIQVKNVGELNMAVKNCRTAELINVAEAMHTKMLGAISDDIARRRREGGAGIVMIAGPSSSGKTTSAKRLSIQLMTNLIVPKMISLDDYFVDREHTPKDENGEYDYESLYSLDLERLNSDLSRLLRGEEINLPSYSFEYGRRIEKEKPLRLDKNDVLVIEGIHGLNPELTASINPDEVYKVYVSALTTLKIDNHNWISTSDNRLLRRIVRDSKYRHISALDTIRRWPSVRRGEEKWIFPFSENADATFNSSLIFELGVMKQYAEPVLREVPKDLPEYAEAFRLLRFLSYFEPIPADQIPTTSLLREFLGGSSFRY